MGLFLNHIPRNITCINSKTKQPNVPKSENRKIQCGIAMQGNIVTLPALSKMKILIHDQAWVYLENNAQEREASHEDHQVYGSVLMKCPELAGDSFAMA
jgi:hypothetical protein